MLLRSLPGSKLFVLACFLVIFQCRVFSQGKEVVQLGILTDCQYCDCPESGIRYYRLSLAKLDSCITVFNHLDLDGVFHMGDMIDHHYASYDSVLPRFREFKGPLHLVLGNHDYMIKGKYKDGLLEMLGLNKGYYQVEYALWTVIVLNGDDLSYFAPQSKKQKSERNDLVGGLYSSLRPNGMPWNGGIGKEQMRWLEEQLISAQHQAKKVIVACHFPLFSKGDHNLFNNQEVFHMLKQYTCVKAYFNGHYHAGNYQEREGIHLVNFKGMVNTSMNAFAVVSLTPDSILIRGYGREPSRRLGIRK